MAKKKATATAAAEVAKAPAEETPWWRKIVDETPIPARSGDPRGEPDGYDFGWNPVYYEDMDDMMAHRCRLERERAAARQYGNLRGDRRNWGTETPE